MARDDGEKLRAAPTFSNWLADAYPDVDAPMVVDPKSTPVTFGCDDGAVAPAWMKTDEGEMVAIAGLLLVKLTFTPPGGAGIVKEAGNGRDWPGPTVRFAGNVIAPEGPAAFVSVNSAGAATPIAVAAT